MRLNSFYIVLSSLVLVVMAGVEPIKAEQVAAVLGDVRISRLGQELSVTAGDVVRAGDRVITGVDGRTVIYWRDGQLLYIGNSTTVLVSNDDALPHGYFDVRRRDDRPDISSHR